MAVVDWNMELSRDYEVTSAPALRVLATLHPSTVTIVYGAGVGMFLDLQEEIANAHPGALFHDKQQGHESLLIRLRKLLAAAVGDLQVDRGFVIHVPSGRRYPQDIAVKLLVDAGGGD